MNTNLFAKLSSKPKTYYLLEELYDAIKTNLLNILRNAKNLDKNLTEIEKDISLYEPRIFEVILNLDNNLIDLTAKIMYEEREQILVFKLII